MAKNDPIFLMPGESIVCYAGKQIKTILGTCVSVCLYNRSSGICGINHYIYPNSEGRVLKHQKSDAYGDLSIEKIIKKMIKIDPDMNNYRAHIYGGGMSKSKITKHFNISQLNVMMAKKVLGKYKIKIEHIDVNNTGGIKIHFDTERYKILKHNLNYSNENLIKNEYRVIVVEDSVTYARVLCDLIDCHSSFKVIAIAQNAYEARELIVIHKPDIITLDLDLPKIGGLAFLKKVMTYFPTKIVVISSLISQIEGLKQKCMDSGAKSCLDKSKISLSKYQGKPKNPVIDELIKIIHSF